MIKIIKISNLELSNFAKEDKEILSAYQNNAEFRILADYLLKGVTEKELFVLLKDICKLNDNLRNQLFDLNLKKEI